MCTLANPMASERCLACACRRPAKLTWRPTAMGREAAVGPRGSGDSGLMESSAYSAPESDSESEVNEYEESEGEGEESDDEESEGEESDDEESEGEESDEDWAEVEDDTSPTAAPPPVGLGHDQATAPCPACDGMIILTLTRERACSAVSSSRLHPLLCSYYPQWSPAEIVCTLILGRPRRQAPPAHLRQGDYRPSFPWLILFGRPWLILFGRPWLILLDILVDRHAMRGMCRSAPRSYLRQGEQE